VDDGDRLTGVSLQNGAAAYGGAGDAWCARRFPYFAANSHHPSIERGEVGNYSGISVGSIRGGR